MTVGFTDSRVFRNRGVVSYGFSGELNRPEYARTSTATTSASAWTASA
jgi:hypothetical protein